jgi:hypothetical protein
VPLASQSQDLVETEASVFIDLIFLHATLIPKRLTQTENILNAISSDATVCPGGFVITKMVFTISGPKTRSYGKVAGRCVTRD